MSLASYTLTVVQYMWRDHGEDVIGAWSDEDREWIAEEIRVAHERNLEPLWLSQILAKAHNKD